MPSVIWHQVFLSKTNNLPSVIWHQVFLSKTNDLNTVIWHQVFLSKTNDLNTVIWHQVFLSKTNNLPSVIWHHASPVVSGRGHKWRSFMGTLAWPSKSRETISNLQIVALWGDGERKMQKSHSQVQKYVQEGISGKFRHFISLHKTKTWCGENWFRTVVLLISAYNYFTFSDHLLLLDIHRSLSNSKSPLVSRTLLSIVADFNYTLVWMVSILLLISSSSSFF